MAATTDTKTTQARFLESDDSLHIFTKYDGDISVVNVEDYSLIAVERDGKRGSLMTDNVEVLEAIQRQIAKEIKRLKRRQAKG